MGKLGLETCGYPVWGFSSRQSASFRYQSFLVTLLVCLLFPVAPNLPHAYFEIQRKSL